MNNLRPPRLTRLAIAFLQFLQYLLRTPIGQLGLRIAIVIIFVPYLIWFLIWTVLGGRPRNPYPDPRVNALWAQIEASRNAPTKRITDRDRDTLQATTWGLAGAAVVILTAIVTASIAAPHGPNRLLLISAGCFAFSIPLLVALGMQQAAIHSQNRDPPFVQTALTLFIYTQMAQTLFCLGLVAMLWSFNWEVSLVFILGVLVAWKSLVSFSKQPSSIDALTKGPTDSTPPTPIIQSSGSAAASSAVRDQAPSLPEQPSPSTPD